MVTGGIERSGRRRNCSKLKRDRKDESEGAYTLIHPAPERASAPADTNTNNILVLRCGAAGFDCGAGCTGVAVVAVAVVGVAAATVVGPVPPASPLPPTIPETLCGYGVDIDAPNPKTGANPVRDIPFDPGHPTPAAAANIKSPPPDPNIPSPPPLRAKHKPSHDFWRANTDTCARSNEGRHVKGDEIGELQLEPDSDLMFRSDSEPAATPIEDQSLNVWITVDSHNPYRSVDTPGEYGAQGSTNSCKEENPMGFKGVWVVE
ncbi:hypothetical protein BU17DRAFT_70114 [Hysterangium stoloniferum]|nr:hypothetical protein BU17DRAFT_70114 [Hysterangium stoloniferum]